MVTSRSLRLALVGFLVAAACNDGKNNGNKDDLGGDGGGGSGVNVTITIVGDGSVGIDGASVCTDETDPCTVNVPVGGTTSVSATASEGYTFESWSCSGSVSTNPALDLELQSGATCVVTFVKIAETLTVVLDNGRGGFGGGSVTSVPSGIACDGASAMCNATLDWGTAVTLTATAAANFAFVGWDGDCAGDASAVDLVIMGATACIAKFEPIQFPLTLSVIGGGSLTAATATNTNLTTCSAASCDVVSIDAPTEVTLLAIPAANFRIGAWSGDCDADASANSDTVLMDAPRTCVVTFVSLDRTLTLATSGGGSITRDPLGTDASGGFTYTHGTEVSLSAIADENRVFLGWTGDCTGDVPTIVVTMDQDRSCVATFTAAPRTLTVTAGPNGAVTSSPVGIDTAANDGQEIYPHGTEVTLTAAPATNYQVVAWSGACAGAGSGNIATVVMSGDQTCGVTFALQKRVLSVDVDGSGRVTSNPGGIDTGAATPVDSFGFDHGTSVTLTATENTGPTQISFNGWDGDCASFGTNKMATVSMTQARSCIARFTVTPYDLTVVATPTGGGNVAGTIVGGGGGNVINCGTGGSDCGEVGISSNDDVSLTATPTSGWRFDQWSGCSVATTATITVQMTANRTCTATFVRRGTVTAATANGGTSTATVSSSAAAPNACAPGASCTVDGGVTVNLDAVAAGGYRFGSWTGTGCSVANATDPTTTLTVVAGTTHTCVANFVQRGTVTTATSGGGANSTAVVASSAAAPNNCAAAGSCTVDGGIAVSLTAVAGSTYRFVNWTGATCAPANANSATTTLTVVAGTTHACTANFVQRGTVTTTTASGGATSTALVSSSAAAPNNCAAGTSCTVDGGTVVSLAAVAGSTYRFVNWTGATCAAANVNSATTTLSVVAGTTHACTANFVQLGTVAVASGTGANTVTVSAGAPPYSALDTCAPGTSCTAKGGTSVTLSATPASGYRFDNWSGCTTAASTSATTTTTVIAGSTVTCTATFKRQYVVIYGVTGTGGGTLTSTCGASPCLVDAGTTVRLTAAASASPAPGFRFAGLSAPLGNVCDFTSGVDLVVNRDQSCAASFTQLATVAVVNGTGGTSATVAATSPPNGALDVCAAGASCTVAFGSTVNLVATPSAGYRFLNWTGAGCNPTDAASATTTAIAPSSGTATCTANYMRQFTVTASTSVTGSMSQTAVSLNGSGCIQTGNNISCVVDSGTDVSFSANTPPEQHRFAWSCTPASPPISPSGTWSNSTRTAQVVDVIQDITCTASYVRQFNATATVVATSGLTSPQVSFTGACTSSGSSVTCPVDVNGTIGFAASTPPELHRFAWSCTPAAPSGGWNNTTRTAQNVTMTQDVTCNANYTRQFVVTYSAGTGGALAAQCGGAACAASPVTVDLNTNVKLTATATTTPSPGWVFSSFSGAGCTFTASGQTVAITANQTCVANFSPRWNLSVVPSPAAGGAISGTGISCGSDCGETNLASTTSIALTAAPSSGFRFSGWSGSAAGCSGNTATTSVAIPSTTPGTYTCTATFAPFWVRGYYPDVQRSGSGYSIGIIEFTSGFILGAFELFEKGPAHWVASLDFDGAPKSAAQIYDRDSTLNPRRLVRDGKGELVVVGDVAQSPYVVPLDSAYLERNPGARVYPNGDQGKGPFDLSIVHDAQGNKAVGQLGIVGASRLTTGRVGATLGRLLLVDAGFSPKFDGFLECNSSDTGQAFSDESNLTAIQSAGTGGHYVAGTAKYGEQYLALVVARVKDTGETQWIRAYHAWDPVKGQVTRNSILPSAIVDAGATVIVVGGYQPTPIARSWQGMAITLNAENGDVVWKNTDEYLATYFYDNTYVYWKDVELASGNAIVTGRYQLGTDSSSEAIAAYFDRANGSLKLASTYGGSDHDFDGLPGFSGQGGVLPPGAVLGSYRPAFLENASDGGFAIAGNTKSFKAGGGAGERTWVLRIDENLETGPALHPEFTYHSLKIPSELLSSTVPVFTDKNGICKLTGTTLRADVALDVTKSGPTLRYEAHAGSP